MSTSCLQFSNCRVGWHEPRRHRSTSNLSGLVLERNKFALGTLYTAMQIHGCVLICHVHLLSGLKALSSAGFCDFHLGLSENRVYSQWNSHLIGIMISKTIGFRGTLFSDTSIYLQSSFACFLKYWGSNALDMTSDGCWKTIHKLPSFF